MSIGPKKFIKFTSEQVSNFFGKAFRRTQPTEELPEPVVLDSPSAVALLVRGGASWSNDATFKVLEKVFPENNIAVMRYSYLGIQHPNYTNQDNFDKLQNFYAHPNELLDHLSDHIQTIKLQDNLKNKPILLIGYSVGGLIICLYLLRYTPNEAIKAVFLLATPFNSDKGFIRIDFPSQANPTDIPLPSIRKEKLLQAFANPIAIFSDPHDRIFDKQDTSLGLDPNLDKPVDSVDHFNFCNDPNVIHHIFDNLPS